MSVPHIHSGRYSKDECLSHKISTKDQKPGQDTLTDTPKQISKDSSSKELPLKRSGNYPASITKAPLSSEHPTILPTQTTSDSPPHYVISSTKSNATNQAVSQTTLMASASSINTPGAPDENKSEITALKEMVSILGVELEMVKADKKKESEGNQALWREIAELQQKLIGINYAQVGYQKTEREEFKDKLESAIDADSRKWKDEVVKLHDELIDPLAIKAGERQVSSSEGLQRQVDTLRGANASLSQQLDSNMLLRQEHLTEVVALRSETQQLRDKTKVQADELNALKEANDNLNATLATLRNQVAYCDKLNVEMSAVRGELERQARNIQELKKEKRELQENKNAWQRDSDRKKEDIVKLKGEVSKWQAEADSNKALAQDFQQKLSESLSDFKRVQEELANNQREGAMLKEREQQLQNELNILRTQKQSTALKEATTKLSESSKLLSVRNSELAASTEKLQKMQSSKEEAEKETSKLKAEIRQFQSELGIVEKLKKEVRQLQEKRDALEQELTDRRKKQLEEAAEQRENIRKLHEALKQQRDEVLAEVLITEKLKEENYTLVVRNKFLESNFKEQQEKGKHQKEEMESLMEELARLRETSKMLVKHVDDEGPLREKLEGEKERSGALKEEVQGLEEKINSLQAEVENKQHSILTLQSSISGLRGKLVGAEKTNETLRATITRLEGEALRNSQSVPDSTRKQSENTLTVKQENRRAIKSWSEQDHKKASGMTVDELVRGIRSKVVFTEQEKQQMQAQVEQLRVEVTSLQKEKEKLQSEVQRMRNVTVGLAGMERELLSVLHFLRSSHDIASQLHEHVAAAHCTIENLLVDGNETILPDLVRVPIFSQREDINSVLGVLNTKGEQLTPPILFFHKKVLAREREEMSSAILLVEDSVDEASHSQWEERVRSLGYRQNLILNEHSCEEVICSHETATERGSFQLALSEDRVLLGANKKNLELLFDAILYK